MNLYSLDKRHSIVVYPKISIRLIDILCTLEDRINTNIRNNTQLTKNTASRVSFTINLRYEIRHDLVSNLIEHGLKLWREQKKNWLPWRLFLFHKRIFLKRDSLFGTLSEMIKSELEKAMFAIVGLGRTSRIVEMGRFWAADHIQRLGRHLVRSWWNGCSA